VKRDRLLYIETYGCQMNLSDSEIIAGIFRDSGYDLTDDISRADVILINTCSVREHAEKRVIGRISSLKPLKDSKPELVLGVVGCMAQRLGKKLIEDHPYVDIVAGPDFYRELPSLVKDRRPYGGACLTGADSGELYEEVAPARRDRVRAWVPIMRGCNNFCSYCIVPYVRGRERSRSHRSVLSEVRGLSEEGFKEVVLLGQNVDSYNDGELNFAGLLRLLDGETGVPRIRFLTSHPKDISDEVLETIAECESLCEHLHLPLQSGSDAVLRRMRRGYSVGKYLDIVEKARRLIPGISITTDIIVGFPGETEGDFERTLEMVKEVEFDYAFTYRYSPRPGTEASRFEDDVPDREKLRRLSELISVQRDITKKVNLRAIGSKVEVILEEVSKKSGSEFLGRTRTDKPVVVRGLKSCDPIGSLEVVKVVGTTGPTLIAEAIDKGQKKCGS